MLIENKNIFTNLIEDLEAFIELNKADLFELNKKITLDTKRYIEEDYQVVRAYLNHFKNNYPTELLKKIKPKGKVLIILSYNEPFIMSIIPIINALAVGNDVTIKESHKSDGFIEAIWKKSGLIEKYKLKIEIISLIDNNEIIKFIKKMQAVYFFGSHKVAQIIAKICGEFYVEFFPSVDTSDVKVFNKNISSIKNDTLLTIEESFTHSGQTCQRIQGIFVHNNYYDDYLKDLKNRFLKLCDSEGLGIILSKDYVSESKDMLSALLLDINKAKPNKIIRGNGLPILVINPNLASDFVKKAYFLPVLWISSFNSEEELLKILNSRRFFLGLNIQSDDKNFVNNIVNNTRFTRYTINVSHTDIRPGEGWGGSWPSGYSGYKSWLEHFSNSYIVLNHLKSNHRGAD